MQGATWRLPRNVLALAGLVQSQRGRSISHNQGTKKKKKKQPIFRFIEGAEGGGRGGAIKCFCLVYKERIFRRSLLKEEGGHLSPNYKQQQSQAKDRGKLEGPRDPKYPLGQEPQAFSPHPQCIYPRGPVWVEEGSMYTDRGGTGLGRGGNNLSASAVDGKGAEGSSLEAVVA